MPNNNLSHLFLDGRFYNTKNYTSNIQNGPRVLARSEINRQSHGTLVNVRFGEALTDFYAGKQRQDFVYIVFKSAPGFELDIEKFDDKSSFRIAFVRICSESDGEGNLYEYQEAGVYLDKTAIKNFLKKIENFINKDTPQSVKKGTPKPQNNSLIANIEDIKAATLRAFWQEPEIPFPEPGLNLWWEVWLDYNGNQDHLKDCKDFLIEQHVQVGQQWVYFPEHTVGYIKGTTQQLESLLYLDCLSELRKPRDLTDFFTHAERAEQNNWINDLLERSDNTAHENMVSVCLLDTGVNYGNPLLTPHLKAKNLTSIFADGHVADRTNLISGHGTPMAGLILYGDLSEVFGSHNRVNIPYEFESVRIIDHNKPHDSQNYGYVTIEAISSIEIINPQHKSVICMAVTTDDHQHLGVPSLWSATVDMISYGADELNDKNLFIISSGNLPDEVRSNYPLANDAHSINDPAQAFNALTVGAYTLKDSLDLNLHPDSTILASRGGMSPCNTTAVSWDKEWSRKPDIVMEGGNQAIQYQGVLRPDSLQLLSTSRGTTFNWLTSFGDTSAATALASRFAAKLYTAYPNYRPETIRGLMVHAAEWTPSMLNNRNLGDLSPEQKMKLLQTVGYGVPNLSKALHSASNSLTMICEAELKPYQIQGSLVKTNKFHLYDLPWPMEVLSDMFNNPVKLTVTLSYFIEPNPGNKRYAKANNYMSHALRFKMIDINESNEAFASRISANMKYDDYRPEGKERNWKLGENLRNKGSIHKDIWEGTAAELATRNKIAIHPITGWWKTRKKLKRYNNTIRYSLIISISSPNTDIDIYQPVQNLIKTKVNIPVEINAN
ncbi:S8 family peptidase [Sphingobacterium faecium]|uniref:S8 family peptidase n=1 Tax=Sphingobacterium faecium TaxID=34087 RepID=UPI0032084944